MPGRRRPPSLVAVVGALLLALAAGSDSHAYLRAVKPPPGEAAEPAASAPPASSASDPRSAHQARQAVEQHDFYDAANPDRERLQRIEEATRHLPYDSVGFPDWMRALREKQIVPRYSVRGEARPELLDLDVIMRNTKEMPHVRFPHLSHTLWLACSNCHPAPFKAEKGSNSIRMADIFRGQYCGMCHDRVAFVTFFSCNRCHSVPASAGDTAR
ncbi:MAG TPA: c(7)-type cytochrome triheme domain-containing protein [Azospira sp.]|nr:c(7)-type cytochrome triheme domain-containing protein [Azospira sp.]